MAEVPARDGNGLDTMVRDLKREWTDLGGFSKV